MPLEEHLPYTPGQDALSILAGWTAPHHHRVDAEAAELTDVQERDAAARSASARRAHHG
jgi:hypothetical protein